MRRLETWVLHGIFCERLRNYNVVLTRNPQNGQYTLSYEDVNDVVKELTATSLNALSSAMSRSGDFSATAFNTVHDHAALIPAVVYAEWKNNKAAHYIDAMELVKEAITGFYVAPSQDTYKALLSIEARYYQVGSFNVGSFANAASMAFTRTLKTLGSEEFSDKVYQDAVHKGDLRTLASYNPVNRNYGIFSVVHGTGGGSDEEPATHMVPGAVLGVTLE